MRAIIAAAVLVLVLTLPVNASQAVELSNLDKRAYKVLIKNAGARRVIEVPPRSMHLVICAKRCRFSIRGSRSKHYVTAIGEDTVTINNRRLKRQRAPKPAPVKKQR